MACHAQDLSLRPSAYQPRRPERTVLYQTVQKELESWLAATSEPIPHFVEQEFRSFLKCGILAYGFARAHCNQCGHDSLVAFSCKGRGICPSCNTRHMAQIAAHLTENVFPKLPVRQWVLSFPKRIRYFLASNPQIVSAVMNILITAIETRLRIAGSRASPLPKNCRLGAVTFIQRFGKALNPHFHFHSCVIDGLFDREGSFYPTNNLSPEDIHATQEHIRKRVLRLFRAKGLIDSDAASDMLEWENSGFSLNANVRIEAHDREGLERLIRYCARPVFASERLDRAFESLRYALPKATPEGQTVLLLKPKELLDKLAQLIPPPRRHRHHYHGVLAPSSPQRLKVTGSPAKSQKDNASEELSPSIAFSGQSTSTSRTHQEISQASQSVSMGIADGTNL